MTHTDPTAHFAPAPALTQRPLLLWLSSGFWLASGLIGIVPVVLALPSLAQASAFVLSFVAVAALSHLLSLAGAVQLFRRRRSAIPLLLAVFVLYIGTLLYSSPVRWGIFTVCLVAVSGSTIGYALLLKRKGVLT